MWLEQGCMAEMQFSKLTAPQSPPQLDPSALCESEREVGRGQVWVLLDVHAGCLAPVLMLTVIDS